MVFWEVAGGIFSLPFGVLYEEVTERPFLETMSVHSSVRLSVTVLFFFLGGGGGGFFFNFFFYFFLKMFFFC